MKPPEAMRFNMQVQGLIRGALCATLLAATGVAFATPTEPYWQSLSSKDKEGYIPAPMPAGVQVVNTENEGPVFATADGRTLYTWPLSGLRNGQAGDRRKSGLATCDGTIYKETSGFMSPYPGGFLLPEPENRKSCEALWPPFLAPADAKPVGKWTTVKRTNGESQWAYDDFPVYTSSKDHKKGDVLGGSNSMAGGAMGAVRYPSGPTADIPSDLGLAVFRTGRMLITRKGFSVYAYDKDTPGKSNCTGACLDTWLPVLAPEMAKAAGDDRRAAEGIQRSASGATRDWSIIERSPGIQQWAYRGKPLYTNVDDTQPRRIIGTDIPDWRNVYTQRALTPPSDFTVQDADLGQVLADSKGKTIYYYSCNDDAMDQQSCDSPEAPQVYRLAICGNFDPKVCNETFPYVQAQPGEKADSALWSVISIDPNTGKLAQAGQAGALQVWAYRERPVYTYGDDSRPGSVDGDNFGEFNGERNGFRAFWLRDDFRGNANGRSPGDRR
jgi:predicted lipoprotein with Yx(FWY)xxD motif